MNQSDVRDQKKWSTRGEGVGSKEKRSLPGLDIGLNRQYGHLYSRISRGRRRRDRGKVRAVNQKFSPGGEGKVDYWRPSSPLTASTG